MYYTIRTSSKPRIFRIYNMTRHCCFRTGVPSLMPLLFVSTQCSVFIVLFLGTGLRHYPVYTQIQNSIHQFILQCTGKPPTDSTIERRCNSTAALLILWRRFRLISSLPFNFCSLFLSNYNFTPNHLFWWWCGSHGGWLWSGLLWNNWKAYLMISLPTIWI